MSQSFAIGKRFIRVGRLGVYYEPRCCPARGRVTRYRTCTELRLWRLAIIWRLQSA